MPGQICFERRQTERQRTAIAKRAQPGVYPINEAIARCLTEHSNNLLGKKTKILFIADFSRSIGLTGSRIQENQVDVRRKV
jgi:hypothetical protein